MMTFQRLLQTLSLLVFFVLLVLAAFPPAMGIPVNVFIRSDPAAVLAAALSGRTFLRVFWLALTLVAASAVLGRFFCGSLCPLGTTIDLSDRLSGSAGRFGNAGTRRHLSVLKSLKYGVLAFLAAAAATGVALAFPLAPLAIATRFYALFIYPVLTLVGDLGLQIIHPLTDPLDLSLLAYAEITPPRFRYQTFSLAIPMLIFSGVLLAPRFWCRYLCPAGAIFALAARRPLIRRRVSDACVNCGLCQRACPMGAIATDPAATDHGECIVCETCVRICPTAAVTFAFSGKPPGLGSPLPLASRRQLLLSSMAGAAAALLTLTGLERPGNASAPGEIVPVGAIRPPGAIPEADFLAICIRCGACMQACPTNTLQPAGLEGGFAGFFSPLVTPRRGACEPRCNACGQVCPTGAIRALPPGEKIWAKMGTAAVLRTYCLAWEYDRKCLVCDEVCPYNALDFRRVNGHSVAVPFVNESRCSGCGYCEYHCPVQARKAIVVSPVAAIRMAAGSYRREARARGLTLEISPRREEPADAVLEGEPHTPPIGPEGSHDLPPGFTS